MLNPSNGSFWIALGLSFEGDNDLTNAFESFEKATELTPFEIEPYTAMIRTSKKFKDYSRVLKRYS
jgi:cytochrome c-type biogenesis protein CcmH/NrfG